MTAIGSPVQAQLEEKLRHREDYARGIQNLMGSQPLLRKHAGSSGPACVLQPSSLGTGGCRSCLCSLPLILPWFPCLGTARGHSGQCGRVSVAIDSGWARHCSDRWPDGGHLVGQRPDQIPTNSAPSSLPGAASGGEGAVAERAGTEYRRGRWSSPNPSPGSLGPSDWISRPSQSEKQSNLLRSPQLIS